MQLRGKRRRFQLEHVDRERSQPVHIRRMRTEPLWVWQRPQDGDRTLQFVGAPLVTWRTEPEVFPRLRPPASQRHHLRGAADLAHDGVAELLLGLTARRRVEREVSPSVDRDLARSRLLQALNELSAVRQALDTALHCLELIRRQEVLEDAGVIIITLKACLEIPKGFDNLAGEGLACKVPQHGA